MYIKKYPRTYHFDESPNLQNDDRRLESIEGFIDQEVVATVKMDGENTTVYRDYIHARALEYPSREDRDWMRSFHATFKHNIPHAWRICGEQLYAEHSIHYNNLTSYFQVFSIWNDKDQCLSWDETLEWCALLGLETVPWIMTGYWSTDLVKSLGALIEKPFLGDPVEGFVIRVKERFQLDNFSRVVGKYVRKDHVQTDEHWTKKAIVKNGLKSNPST